VVHFLRLLEKKDNTVLFLYDDCCLLTFPVQLTLREERMLAVVDHYSALREALSLHDRQNRMPRVLYLCDNCGEIVFDGLLIKQLNRLGCQVTAAVRESPIINDATLQDAQFCGLDTMCTVISNGTGCPGTPLASCSTEFKQCFQEADLIISKGMGNFESLSEVSAPIFFLFTVKCSRVADHLTKIQDFAPGFLQGTGEMVLLRQKG
ncbi:MAG: DUF89 family protein, partial [Candidatus Electrothrix sp. AS4_5]|nr:DUF89 family protein [Candidatus Electrothrix gigas]